MSKMRLTKALSRLGLSVERVLATAKTGSASKFECEEGKTPQGLASAK